MKFHVAIPLALVFAVAASAAHAYEVDTHAQITKRALERSVLGAPNTFLNRLGLDSRGGLLGKIYYDAKDGVVRPRERNDEYEGKIIGRAAIDLASINAWVAFGAIREDDVPNPPPDHPNPIDDPWNKNLYRVLHHFFDPYFNRGLDAIGTCVYLSECDIHKAPDWAIGSRNSFANPNTPEAGRRNHFTVFDAREAMYRALTLRRQDAPGTFSPLLEATDPSLSVREKTRKAYWATTFRALGDILHLNQDMAQPQHTRNEPHSGKGWGFAQTIATGHKSVFEDYIDKRATQSDDVAFDYAGALTKPMKPAELVFIDYPPVVFPRFSDYWSTSPGAGTLNGKGLADYSSRGFFTAAKNTNVLTNEYPSPNPNPASYAAAPESIEIITLLDGSTAKVKHLVGSVSDFYTGQSDPNVRLATRSVLPSGGGAQLSVRRFLLTQSNYDDAAKLLLGRAASYSAGLINHFFRGTMQITVPDAGIYALVDHADIVGINDADAALTNNKGFDKIKLKLTNTSVASDGSGGLELMANGQIEAVVKFHRNLCFKDNLTGMPGPSGADPLTCVGTAEDIVVSDPLINVTLGSVAQEFTFQFQKAIPLNATDVRLQVVYRGPLGLEQDAVVVTTKDISEPTYLSFMNTTDYWHIRNEQGTPSVKSRTEIDTSIRQNGALRNFITSACINTAVTPNRLQGTCFRPFPITTTIKFGVGETVAATTDQLQPLEFVRVAVLGDTDKQIVHKIYSGGFSVDFIDGFNGVEWQGDYDAAQNQIMVTYPIFELSRGITHWALQWASGRADVLPTIEAPDDAINAMTALNVTPGFVPTLKPVKMLIVGW